MWCWRIMVLSPSFAGVRYYQSKDNRTRFMTGLGESGLLRNLSLFLMNGLVLILDQKTKKFNVTLEESVAVDNWLWKEVDFLCMWIKENTNWDYHQKENSLGMWGWINCFSAQACGRNGGNIPFPPFLYIWYKWKWKVIWLLKTLIKGLAFLHIYIYIWRSYIYIWTMLAGMYIMAFFFFFLLEECV